MFHTERSKQFLRLNRALPGRVNDAITKKACDRDVSQRRVSLSDSIAFRILLLFAQTRRIGAASVLADRARTPHVQKNA